MWTRRVQHSFGMLPSAGQTPQKAAQPDVDMGQDHLSFADDQQRQVVDALELGPRDVDDLLVEESLAQENLGLELTAAGLQLRKVNGQSDRIGGPGADLATRGDQQKVGPAGGTDEDLLNLRVRVAEADRKIPEATHGKAIRIDDRPRQELRKIQERARPARRVALGSDLGGHAAQC